MKKIFNTISILLLLQTASYAQQPTGRTTETKIADVLAQQPAAEISKFLLAMGELENFTAEDVAQLLSKLRAPGSDNSTIEYATNSYALYVMQPGKEAAREKYVQGLLLSLDRLNDRDNKGYVLELLKFCAKNEAIEKVSSFLTDEYLAEKAARVLSAIHTNESAAALNKALAGNVTEKTATAIIGALGEVRHTDAEDRILELLKNYNSDNFQYNAYAALSKLGTAKSYDVLYSKAKASNLEFERTNSAALLLELSLIHI